MPAAPPGTVGFRRYCPYTAAPSRTGEWKAPDLARARRLVAASGTRGMKRDGLDVPWFLGAGGGGAVRALEKLGYRASIRRARPRRLRARMRQPGDTGRAGRDDRLVRPPKVGVIAPSWFQVHATRSQLLLRPADRRPNHALDSRPSTRAPPPLWAGRARHRRPRPAVPLFTPSHAHIVSERVGNYLSNPELGVPVRPALGAIEPLSAESWQCS